MSPALISQTPRDTQSSEDKCLLLHVTEKISVGFLILSALADSYRHRTLETVDLLFYMKISQVYKKVLRDGIPSTNEENSLNL